MPASSTPFLNTVWLKVIHTVSQWHSRGQVGLTLGGAPKNFTVI